MSFLLSSMSYFKNGVNDFFAPDLATATSFLDSAALCLVHNKPFIPMA
jgi:hypothetical protein